MALIQCKECSAAVAESAEFCPKCGFKFERAEPKSRLPTFLCFLNGPFVIPAATAILAYVTFLDQKQSHENEKLQTMIESAVSNDAVKERTATRAVTYLAKHKEFSPSFALTILGTVVRNTGDEKLRGEIYDAIENLAGENDSNLTRFDRFERLEVFCLRAALTPSQYQRQKNIHQIEEFVTDDGLRLQASSKLLSLTQHLSDPQTLIDLLLSVSAFSNSPDMLEKVIPILCKAVKLRDYFENESNQDVAEFLKGIVERIEAVKAVNQSIAQVKGSKEIDSGARSTKLRGEAGMAFSRVREASRYEIRLHLARALVARNEDLRYDSLKEFEKTMSSQGLADDARLLLNGIGRTVENPNLPAIVNAISDYLDREKNVHGPMSGAT